MTRSSSIVGNKKNACFNKRKGLFLSHIKTPVNELNKFTEDSVMQQDRGKKGLIVQNKISLRNTMLYKSNFPFLDVKYMNSRFFIKNIIKENYIIYAYNIFLLQKLHIKPPNQKGLAKWKKGSIVLSVWKFNHRLHINHSREKTKQKVELHLIINDKQDIRKVLTEYKYSTALSGLL